MDTSNTKPVFGPYTPMRRAGSLYFISGQVGVDPQSKTASDDTSAQTRQALTNLKDTLATEGVGLDQVVKTTIYVTDITEFNLVNKVYTEFFNEPRPARSTVGVKELPKVAGDTPIKVEIEAIAMAKEG